MKAGVATPVAVASASATEERNAIVCATIAIARRS
jgi:hypothetical protein